MAELSFFQPNQSQADPLTEGTAPAASGAAGLDPSAALVAELLSRLETAPKPVPPKTGFGRNLVGSVGDALTAAASVRAGGSPPGIGSFAASQARQQAEFRAANAAFQEKQTELNNKILLFKVEQERQRGIDVQKELARVRDNNDITARQKARDDRNDASLSQRQLENDERDAGIALNKSKRDALLKLSRAAAEAGLPPGTIPNVDPKLLRWQDLIDLSMKIGGQGGNPAERIASQIASAQAADPDLVLSGVGFSGEDGVANARLAVSPLSRLTDADKRFATQAGVEVFTPDGNARSPQDVLADVAAIKKKQIDTAQREREARLSVAIKRAKVPNATVGQKIAEHLTIVQNARAAKILLEGAKGDDPGGPIAGRLPAGLRFALTDALYGRKSGDLNREVTVRLQNIFNVNAKIRSGAAVTTPEEIRLGPEFPLITDRKIDQLNKLNLVIEFESKFISNIQKTFSITDEDLEFLKDELADASFIPTESEAGDMTIFGGDQP